MKREQIAELILSWYVGEITEAQQEILDQWLAEDPSHQQLFEQITQPERIKNRQLLLALFDQDNAWEKIHRATQNRRKRTMRVLRYAATILLLIGISVYYLIPPTETAQEQHITLQSPENVRAILTHHETGKKNFLTENTYAVQKEQTTSTVAPIDTLTITIPRGGEFHLTLQDGTEIWLNSETQIRFPSRFDTKQREVFLVSGEAYFQVAKNPQHPFIVSTPDTRIEVLGTAFNLQNYPNEPHIVTTLVNGAVQLSTHPKALKPGQQSLFDKKNRKTILQEVDTNIYTAWKEGRFIFKGTPLENILNQLSRWYNVEFKYEDELLKTLLFSGNVPKYEDGNTILEILKSTGHINFIQQEDVILVKNK